MRKFESCALLFLLAGTVLAAEPAGPGPQEVAKAYGAPEWGRVDRVQFTFNFAKDGKTIVSRAWTWEPKTDQVTYKGPDESGKPVEKSYNRRTEAKDNEKLEKGFINDSYWLLFPMHLAWDQNVEITQDGEQPLPMGEGKAPRLTVRYGNAGFTPGDVYELYLGKDNRITAWSFIRSGKEEPRPMSWTTHAAYGPIIVALDHRTADGSGRLWFDNTSMTIDGKEMKPEPLD